MYYSSVCFLIPIILLDLPYYIIISLIYLTTFSFIFHNFPNKITRILDHCNIINTCSLLYFDDFTISLYYLCLYGLEQRYRQTDYVMYFIYFLSYTKYCNNPYSTLYFFTSILIFTTTYFQEKNSFNFYNYQRWLWHFGQGMYIYHSISENYSNRLEL